MSQIRLQRQVSCQYLVPRRPTLQHGSGFLVGWLHLSEQDQKRARDYLANFRAEDTLDELGFGIMRDAFADLFFPCTSTVMTRTRYLIFVPSLYLIVEKERLSGDRASRRLTELENRLRAALDRPEVEGVIGRRAKEALARFPSNVYWNSLKQLNIFLRRGWSQAYYHDHLRECYDQQKAVQDDDGVNHLPADNVDNWDKVMPSLTQTELFDCKTLDFELTAAEADYLRARYSSLANNKVSLLDFLVSRRFTSDFKFPWDAPCPEALANPVQHARRLSILAKGATLVYYNMLLEEQSRASFKTPDWDFREAFAKWWDSSAADLLNWDLAEYATLVSNLGALRSGDKAFFESFLNLIQQSSVSGKFISNPGVQRLIRGREHLKRPRKARLFGGDQLRNWESPNPEDPIFVNFESVPYWLSYRSGIGGTFVREISKGLSRTHTNVRTN